MGKLDQEEVVHQQIVGIVYRAHRAQQKKEGSILKRAGRRALRLATSGVTLAATLGVAFGAAFIDVVDDELIVVRLGRGWLGPPSVAREVRPTTLQRPQPAPAAATRNI